MTADRWQGERAVLARLAVVNAGIVVLAALSIFPVRLDAALASVGRLGHWPGANATVAVVDATGQAAWHRATRVAVERWNAAGAGPRLRWASGAGGCGRRPGQIAVCLTPYDELAAAAVAGTQGRTDPDVDGDDHTGSVVVRVCSDCGLSELRRVVVAVHEVGHALGLHHTRRATSVMNAGGGRGELDPLDVLALRRLYAHQD